ncbi:MAG: aldo/keto reductase [Chlamydiales bacterium 38-26]|nr:aldo/keto reductase [Chlamydiales bacterium]OJV11550.1 MAG: aldo/keto reductase [Chlamydiales bacterium 38-26]
MENITSFSGVNIPCIIYGTAWKEDRTAELVTEAITLGFRGIDTACQPKHYNEAGVGEALQRLALEGIKRESLFIQTKFTPVGGHDPQSIPYDQNAPLAQQVIQSFEVSKKNLKLNYVDSLILHSPLANIDQLRSVWQSMESIYARQETKLLGISNCYDLELLKTLYHHASIKPAIVQNRFYRQTHYDKNLRKWCKEKNMIYQSFWTLTANPHILNHDLVKKIAEEYKKTEAQIFFRFLTQIGIVPLIGACSQVHMKQDLDIFNFNLSQSMIEELESLLV